VLVVVAVPVEGWVGEDEVYGLALDLWDFGELGAAVAYPDLGSRSVVEGDGMGWIGWGHWL